MAVHQNSLANLRKWKKGESGNPNGRKPGTKWRPGRKIVDYLELELEELAAKSGVDPKEAGRLVAKKWLAMILAGDVPALKEWLARRDGPVRQEVSMEHSIAEVVRAETEALLTTEEGVDVLLPDEGENGNAAG